MYSHICMYSYDIVINNICLMICRYGYIIRKIQGHKPLPKIKVRFLLCFILIVTIMYRFVMHGKVL